MISSLFGQTRPANYILVSSALFVFFILANTGGIGQWGIAMNFFQLLLNLGCLIFSVFLVNFIVQRNQLTAAHSFALLFYSIFLVLFPKTLLDSEAIYATVCLLLAQRRLVSMRSLKNVKAKVFDGAFWICVSSLFINWMALYIVLVWLYIAFYVPKQLNYWFIPLVAAMGVALTGWSVSFLLGDPGYLYRHYTFSLPTWNADAALMRTFLKAGIFILAIMAAGAAAFVRQGKSGQGKVTQLRLLLLAWAIGILVAVLTGERIGSTIMIIFLPSAVFMARYAESIRRELLRDLMIFGLMVLCLATFFLQWVVK